jgi:glucose-6-phosphate 1-dehydrogenase
VAVGRRTHSHQGGQGDAGHRHRGLAAVPATAARRLRRFRIWPDAAITLALAGKKPGAAREAQLQELSFAEQPGSSMRPYDRLIGAALEGRRVLFARQDTVEAAWRVVDQVLDDDLPVHSYPRGTWGPKEADALLPDGDSWHDPAG